MERETEPSSSRGDREEEDVKIIEWEEFDHELTRLWSLSSALKLATEKKQTLQRKLESLIQLAFEAFIVSAESLRRINELEEMRQRLEAKKLMVDKTSVNCKVTEQDLKKKEDDLSAEVRSLLVGGTTLSIAKSKLQESNCQLEGESGYAHLKTVTNKLRKRQQYMVSQVSFIYPLKIEAGPSQDQELESFPGGSRLVGTKPVSQGSVRILGLPFSMAPFTKMSFFTDKKEVQKSATALGYVAHAVSLLALYLGVPIRYPLRLGGSKTYIRDYAPYIEPSASDMSPVSTLSENAKFVEFPLFLDGQDTTRAAYAVFLLNKNIEQLLNFVGESSLGPRQMDPYLLRSHTASVSLTSSQDNTLWSVDTTMVSSSTTISASTASKSRSLTPQRKITLKVKTQQDGREDVYKIGYNAHMKKLMDACCTKRNFEKDTVRFIFGRKELKPRQTPAQLMMEEGDIIDLVTEQGGG
ncbi:hypothetical protein Bca101_039972 [Brassica carinata]